jgi:hypothetical protein
VAEYIIDPSEHEIKSVLATMIGESDRGKVLVAASLIEWQMERLLKVAFLSRHKEPDAKLIEQIKFMLDPTHEKSILGAAAPRARMCRLLGLISEETHCSLKKFLVFRNHHFAHARRDVSLSNPPILKDLNALLAMMPSEIANELRNASSPTDKFSYVVICLYFLLDPQYQDDHTESHPSSS